MCAVSVYLTYGQGSSGEFFNIDSQKSGKTILVCPFCKVPLIAVRGKIKKHHFRHDGETCNESLTEITEIDGWDHFHLSVPGNCVSSIKEKFNPKGKSSNFYSQFGDHELLKYDLISERKFMGGYEFTDRSLIILGALPLPRFEAWMRQTLKDRMGEIKESVKNGFKDSAHLDIEAYRQQTILQATLYLIEIDDSDGNRFYKVGRTSRDPEVRLKEIIADISRVTHLQISGKIVRAIENAGHVEQFSLYKYSNSKFEIGSFTEYLKLDDRSATKIKGEFTRLSKSIKPLNKEERFIAYGRWKYEEKRLSESKKGIEKVLNHGMPFGRPKGSGLSKNEFLDKHFDIVELLKEGRSISEIAQLTKKSRSTIKRVKLCT